jgi:hypothetical protein
MSTIQTDRSGSDDHIDINRLRIRSWFSLLPGLRPQLGCEPQRASSDSGKYRPRVVFVNVSSRPMLNAFFARRSSRFNS